jgi:hypothetical protein
MSHLEGLTDNHDGEVGTAFGDNAVSLRKEMSARNNKYKRAEHT